MWASHTQYSYECSGTCFAGPDAIQCAFGNAGWPSTSLSRELCWERVCEEANPVCIYAVSDGCFKCVFHYFSTGVRVANSISEECWV